MSGSILPEESLRSGLLKFSQEFDKNKIEHFVFFGTLLGLCRSGKPIVGDDDVDFYVNHKHYEQVQVLIQSLGFWIDYDSFPNNSDPNSTAFLKNSNACSQSPPSSKMLATNPKEATTFRQVSQQISWPKPQLGRTEQMATGIDCTCV